MSVSEEQLFIDNLETLIATSQTFQTWTSTASVTLAKARVYTSRLPNTEITKPFAQIGHDSGFIKKDYDRPSQAQMYIIFVGNTSDGIDDETSMSDFITTTGKIIDDLYSQSLVNGYLRIETLNMNSEYAFSEDNQLNDEELMISYTLTTGV